MAVRKLTFHNKAFYELRTGSATRAIINSRAAGLAQAASSRSGRNYSWESHEAVKRPYGRWRATVWPADVPAMRSEAKRGTLLSVLGGAGTW